MSHSIKAVVAYVRAEEKAVSLLYKSAVVLVAMTKFSFGVEI